MKRRDLVTEKVRKSAWTLTVSALTVKVIGAVFKVPLLRVLTDEGMGYFNTAYTIYSFLYLICTAGVPKGISILLSTKNTTESYRKVEAICFRFFLILGAGVSVLLLILSFPLSRLIGNSDAAFTLIVMAPSLIFISLSGVCKGIFNERRDFLSVAVSDVIESVMKLSLGLAFSLFATLKKWPLPIVSAFSVLGITIGSVIGFLYLLIHYKAEKNSRKLTVKVGNNDAFRILKELFSITFPITLAAGVNSLSHLIDLGLIMKRLMAGGVSSEDAIALYGNYTTLVVPMFALGGSIAVSVSLSALPQLCRERNDRSGFFAVYHSYTVRMSYIIVPMSFGLFFFGETALRLLFPASSVEIAAPLLKLISPAILLSALFTMTSTALEAVGKQSAALLSVTLGAVAKIAVSYFCIGNPDIGMKGAPLGTLVSCGVTLLTSSVLLYMDKGVFPDPIREFISPFLCSVPAFLAVSYYLRSKTNVLSFRDNLFAVILGGVIYIFILGCVFYGRKLLFHDEKLCNVQ